MYATCGHPTSIQQAREDPSKGKNDASDSLHRRDKIALDLHTATILAAIKNTKKTLEIKIEAVTIDVTLQREDHKKLADRLTGGESTLVQARPMILSQDEKLAQLEKVVKSFCAKMDDALVEIM
ncbi:hypothetical protein NDU88_006429 [Pleurodeles waltl]|uniref:Uncharacterized protein n=1 Tax=Pleurodeles waltl TaxID=8319 RepID=A0AAV7PIB0_PLEWA|nr:hypothetical protein NDU88_006429 [Pleurodeles waltl]